ncbi:hypothetical protein Tco_0387434 [Tanacetum coccineum]
MTTLADKAILLGADNRPPMLEKDMKQFKLTVISRQQISFSKDYHLRSMHWLAIIKSPRIWNRITTFMQRNFIDKTRKGVVSFMMNSMRGKNREFTETFHLLLNDMNIYNMKLEQFQVNTKFLNTLPPEWSKFMTDVKLVRDLHTTNIDQLHAYLGQHEFHANEVRLMHERNSDPLALSPQYGSPYQSQQYSTHQSSTPLSITYPSNDYQSSIHHNVYSPSSSIPQLEYAPTVNQQSEFSQPDSGLIVPVFQKGDDPLCCNTPKLGAGNKGLGRVTSSQ